MGNAIGVTQARFATLSDSDTRRPANAVVKHHPARHVNSAERHSSFVKTA